jgi:hypothetical protein
VSMSDRAELAIMEEKCIMPLSRWN